MPFIDAADMLSVTPNGFCRAVIADYPLRLQLPGMGHVEEQSAP